MKYEQFKSEMLSSFKEIFPIAEIKNSQTESWIEFAFNGEIYGVRFSDLQIYQAIELNASPRRIAAGMLRDAVTEIMIGREL